MKKRRAQLENTHPNTRSAAAFGNIRVDHGTTGHNRAQQGTTGHNRAQQGHIAYSMGHNEGGR